jgi:biotin-dependent carboxylase-like uncharacterized protein
MSMLRIDEIGIGTTLQDRGRVGLAALGVPQAGAVDPVARDRANRLVGNTYDAATIETHGGLVIVALRPLVVATTEHRHTLRTGDRLAVDPPAGHMWAYLAVRGGIDVDPVLGSRSHDTLSGIGPAPLQAGLQLPIGSDPGTELPTDHAPTRSAPTVARLWRGPRADWFLDPVGTLLGRSWVVSTSVSRVGVRLEAGLFKPIIDRQLQSEGLVGGAIQITPSGQPIVMLADHPTTGGYPVVAVVEPDDLGIVAQARPGSELRFAPATTP